MLFVVFILGILIGLLLLTNDKSRVIIEALGSLFLGVILIILYSSFIGINNNKEIEINYKMYRNSIQNLEETIEKINKDINSCRKIDDFKDFITLVCKNHNAYIKEKYFKIIVSSLKDYFYTYTYIHNFRNPNYLIKFLKDKTLIQEKSFLETKQDDNETKGAQ